jgi:hypothetical protein
MSAASDHSKATLLTGPNDPLEQLLRYYLQDFIANNSAAKVVADGMRVIGIGFRPIIDHITFRTLDVESRAKEFIKYGYKYDAKMGIIEYESWWAKVYRKVGYPPIFIDQAFEGKRGKGCVIPEWVETFGDQLPHHVTIQVDDIEQAAFFLEKQGVPMAGNIIGDRGSDLRQIFTKPDMKKKKPFTVLELAERHRGYQGFQPPKAS